MQDLFKFVWIVSFIEEFLFKLGFKQLRVRIHGDNISRIEVSENEFGKIIELKNKIIEKQNALRKKLNENAKEELRNLRKQIKCYVEESGEGTEEVLKKFLVEQKNEYMKTVNSLVTKNIEMQLKDYNEKLDKIIDAISTTGEERKRRLEEIQILLGKVTECLDKGLNIQTKLESVLNDVIEQENL